MPAYPLPPPEISPRHREVLDVENFFPQRDYDEPCLPPTSGAPTAAFSAADALDTPPTVPAPGRPRNRHSEAVVYDVNDGQQLADVAHLNGSGQPEEVNVHDVHVDQDPVDRSHPNGNGHTAPLSGAR